MRKAFLIAIATCCIGTSKVYGQIGEPRNDLAVGFNAGYTLNQVMFNPTIQQNSKGHRLLVSRPDIPAKSISKVCVPSNWRLIIPIWDGKN